MRAILFILILLGVQCSDIIENLRHDEAKHVFNSERCNSEEEENYQEFSFASCALCKTEEKAIPRSVQDPFLALMGCLL